MSAWMLTPITISMGIADMPDETSARIASCSDRLVGDAAGGPKRGVEAMKRVFAVLLAATCVVVVSTPSFARGSGGHGGGRGVFRNQLLLQGSAPAPAFQSRIPSPLAAPSQAPVINGPSGRSPYGGVM
jgi:hypothetical protein